MANKLTEIAGGMLPSIEFGQVLTWGVVFFCAVLFAIFLGFGTWYLIKWLRYNVTIRYFRKVGGNYVQAFVDKGSILRVGLAGDYWMHWKRTKRTTAKPVKWMGKTEVWYYEGKDGEAREFCLDDLDENAAAIGCKSIDPDMRLTRLAIQKNLMSEFKPKTFWQKYEQMIMSVLFILIVTICLILLFNKMEDGWAQSSAVAGSNKEMAESTQAMANSVNEMAAGLGSMYANLESGARVVKPPGG